MLLWQHFETPGMMLCDTRECVRNECKPSAGGFWLGPGIGSIMVHTTSPTCLMPETRLYPPHDEGRQIESSDRPTLCIWSLRLASCNKKLNFRVICVSYKSQALAGCGGS